MSERTDITIAELPLSVIEGEPRARDLDIGEKLGFGRDRDIRKLIKANIEELQAFGVCATASQTSPQGGRPSTEYWLNEEQALLIATLSQAPKAPIVRAMLIRTFVAWRRGHLATELPADVAEMVRRTDGICRMLSSKVTGIEKALPLLASQVALEMGPAMLQAFAASQNFAIRRGMTAGQIWRAHGFPPIRVTCWFSNRLREMGCAIEGGGFGELGLTKARLFDPDKADVWLKNGGRLIVENKIAERRGQGVLKLVPKDGSQPEARA